MLSIKISLPVFIRFIAIIKWITKLLNLSSEKTVFICFSASLTKFCIDNTDISLNNLNKSTFASLCDKWANNFFDAICLNFVSLPTKRIPLPFTVSIYSVLVLIYDFNNFISFWTVALLTFNKSDNFWIVIYSFNPKRI